MPSQERVLGPAPAWRASNPREGCGASGDLRLPWACVPSQAGRRGRCVLAPCQACAGPREGHSPRQNCGLCHPITGASSPTASRQGLGSQWFCESESSAEPRVGGSVVQTALGHRLPADPWAQPLLGGLEGTADPGKGQTILDAGTVGWGLAEARPGPRVSPLTREPWRRHVPPLQEEREEASGGATQSGVRRRLEASPLWLLQRDTLRVSGPLAPASAHGSCCSVFWEGPLSAPLPPPTCGSHNREQRFPPSSAEIHPEGQAPGRGPIHHKKLFSFPRAEEMKTSKTNAGPSPRRVRTAIPFTGILRPNRLM